MGSETVAAEHFVDAFLANSWEDLRLQLADDVAFRALLPPRISEVDDADAAIALMSSWFDNDERVTHVETIDTEPMSVKQRASYRFRTHVESSGKSYRLEQHAFLTLNQDGGIAKADLICSGWVQSDTR